MSEITQTLKNLLSSVLQELGLELPEAIHFEHPADAKFGDYSTNLAMTSFQSFQPTPGSYANPRALAEDIVEHLNKKITTDSIGVGQVIERVELAGPGFINFFVSDQYLLEQLRKTLDPNYSLLNPTGTGKKVVVEYSSPNIAKPFTIGHLRSTIIGDSVANLLQTTGWTVFRDNHLGDWGTQFGKQIYAIKHFGNEQEIEEAENPVKELVNLYIKFHQEAELHPEIEEEARAWFKRLEDGDQEARRLWKKCIEWSLKEFNRIYDQLGIHFTENHGQGYGESFFEDKMGPVINELDEKNLLKTSEGARLVFFPNEVLPPLMVLKKDGATLYATRDLATDRFRLQHYGHDIVVINEVGAEQSLYWQQIFLTEELLGWYKPGQRVHVKHGLYRFKDQKMSTRKGNVIWLEDVLNEAYQRVYQRSQQVLVKKNERAEESTTHQGAQFQEQQLWKIAIGAIKWNDLKRESVKQVAFDWNEILNLQGNSGPYIQYTYARCVSVLQKAQNYLKSNLEEKTGITRGTASASLLEAPAELPKSSPEYHYNPEEKAILHILYRFDEVVQRAAAEYAPHHVCTYLFGLAQAFNAFYNQHSILGSDNTPEQLEFRTSLTQGMERVLKAGLLLLGIQPVEKM